MARTKGARAGTAKKPAAKEQKPGSLVMEEAYVEEAPEDRGDKDEKRPAGTRRTLERGQWRLRSPKRFDAFSPASGRSLPSLRGQGQPEGQMSIGRLVCGYATPHKQVP